jgi:hypothetical protein
MADAENEVAAGAFAGRGVPRSRISPALSHSRRTGAEINGQNGLLGKGAAGGIDDKDNDVLCAGYSHHATRNWFGDGANKPRRACGR